MAASSGQHTDKGRTMSWMATDILEATGGLLLCGNIKCAFSGISIDSRKISTDDLFVAIKGDVHDGHSFVGDVIEKGIRGIIINRDNAALFPKQTWQSKGILCVSVDDTIKALGDLAVLIRKRSNVLVVAITGSNGKTTTRKMTAAVVSQRFRTLATSGNLNNEIGLPLTLFKLDSSHERAVLELGMNHPGEIGRLGEICTPDIGVITNIGPAHLEGLGSMEGVMHAKGELLDKIRPDGTAVLNADDPMVLQLANKTSKEVLLYGLSKDAAVRALSVKEQNLGLSVHLRLPKENIVVDLRTPARFMVSNALAAAAVGHLMSLSAQEIKAGLEKFEPVRGRLNLFKTGNGINIIDDTYNANPGSMSAAISTLKSLKGNSRGILIVGDMLELGNHSEYLHKKIGSLAAGSDIKRLYITGKFSESVAEGAREEHMDTRKIFIGTREEILHDLTGYIQPDDWVLIKGSRAMGMERIVEGLKDWAGG